MRGSRRKGRRLRRAGATFSLIGLVMTVFLAIGQVGLIAANADGWSDRSGDGSASAESGRGDGFTVKASDAVSSKSSSAKGAVAAPQVLASTPIVANMIDAYEGTIAGTSNWTAGNLCQGNGICYKELENVPHRVKLKTLTPGTEYQITILLDAFDGAGNPGYDNLNSATGFAGVQGSAVSVTQNANTTCGQSTTCLSYTLTFTASAADAEIRFNAHLAIGAHLYGGSSLSARIDGSAKNVPLPVGDILLDIRAHKFNDLNGNGTQDQGEPDLAGWQMTLYSGPDCSGQPIDVSGNAGTAPNPGTTGAAGNVDWTNLSASDGDNDGAFSVKETLQAGWENTTPLCREVSVVGLQNVAIFGNQQKLPELTIDKTGPATVPYGDQVTYEITVENIGNGSTADDVIITDSVPAELDNVAATYSFNGGADQACSVVGNDVSCNVGVMDPGDSVVVTITADAPSDSCPTFTNQAFVGVGTDTPLGSNEVETTVTGCAPDLSIDKKAVNEAGAPITEVSPGDSFSYVITVTNDGNEDATGVVVTDDLDDTLTIDAASFAIGAASGTCDIDGTDNSIRCPQDPGTATLQPGESMVVTVDVTTAADICGALINSAHVDWAEDGSGEGLDSSLVTVDVTGCAPELTIAKTGPATVPFGGEVTYEITVENIGNAPTANDVIITDSVPAELDNVAATYSFNGGADQACSVVGNDVSCNVGVMDPGDSVVVTITADAPSDSCPSFTNQAFVGDLGSNEVDTDVTGCAADLELHKTGPATAEVGGLVTYTVTVENNGNAATSDPVVVTDAVDSDLSGVTASFSLNGGPDQACDVVGNDVSCDLGILQSGDSAEITISGTTPTDICPEIVNQAFIGDLGSEIVTTTIDCPPPGIDLVKGGDDMAHVGDTVTYTFDVSLTPDSLPLENVTLTDPICDTGTISGPTGDDGNAILEQGETWSYTCTHVVTESDPDPLPNTAHVSGWFGQTEVTDEDSHEVDIIHPAIEIVKRARPQSGSPGEVITYHYTITNIGDVVLHDITVDDDVIGHVCDIAELQPDESTECTKDYKLPSDGTIKVTNVGTAEGEDPLGETVKDDDTQTVDVILGQTITKTPPGPIAFTGTSSVIPLGALLLVFVTAGTALLWVGRRRGRQTSTE